MIEKIYDNISWRNTILEENFTWQFASQQQWNEALLRVEETGQQVQTTIDADIAALVQTMGITHSCTLSLVKTYVGPGPVVFKGVRKEVVIARYRVTV